ncbi:hypothetical protein ACTWQB_05740 [Piscibacillus sp. B03]
MKNFIGIFLFCIFLSSVFMFLFLGLILEYMWALIMFPAFFLAVLISVFKEQHSRIEGLEKKVDELSIDQETI